METVERFSCPFRSFSSLYSGGRPPVTPTAQLDDEAATFCPLQESLGEGRSTSSSGLEQQPLFERHLWVLGHRGQGRAPGPHRNHWPDLSSPMVICFGCSFECLTSQAPSLQRRGTGCCAPAAHQATRCSCALLLSRWLP